MALKLKYTDEHGIVHIKMSPNSSPRDEINDPKFDTINNRFGTYDLFGGKYEDKTDSSGDGPHSLFRSRYNSIEEELANTPYAFATERSLRSANQLDITIDRSEISPSKDIEDDRFFRRLSLDYDDVFRENAPSFTVTQLIHAQDRYFDLSSKKTFIESGNSEKDTVSKGVNDRTKVLVGSAKDAFRILNSDVKTQTEPVATTVIPIAVRKKEKSFAILTETPTVSRPSSPRSLPVDTRHGRVSPFKGRGFREETSRHNTPRTSTNNSRANSPPRRRTNSLSRIDKMAAVLPPPILLPPRNFLKENIEEIREISEINREKHEAEAEQRKIEEEVAIFKEMGLDEKDAQEEAKKSVVASRNNSRANSRSNSPSKINLRSRSNSPSTKKDFVNVNDGLPKVANRSRVRSVSKSQPQSNDGSPKNSKIPKRQSSVSPNRTKSLPRKDFISKRPNLNNNLNQNRFMSNSTSSIHETIKIGSQIHDKRGISQSAQHLSIAPALIKGKPPISPGKGPPPSNRTINAKRLSPIVGTPSKSPVDDPKSAAKTKPGIKKPVKTGTTVKSKIVSRDPSPDKKNAKPKTNVTKPISRTPSTKSIQKPLTPTKTDAKKTITRTDSNKSLNRASSTKNLAGKPPLKRSDSKLSNKSQSTNKLNEVGKKDTVKSKKDASDAKADSKVQRTDSATDPEEIPKQDNETQYDKLTNDKGELVILTKKNIVSMTTAAITSQPLEVVATVTNQLPAALEKAREKRNIERLNSKDSIKDEDKDKTEKVEVKVVDEKKKTEKVDDKNLDKPKKHYDDNLRLKPLQPPFNDPQLDKVRQKIDDILKTPEISRENILTSSAKSRETKFKNIAEKTKADVKESKDLISERLIELKNEMFKQKEESKAAAENVTSEIRSEATKIVDSIITPVEEPKEIESIKEKEPAKEKVELVKEKVELIKEKAEIKKDTIEPIVMVVNEKKKDLTDAVKVNETLVQGDAEVEVQSSNVSTPVDKDVNKDGNGSDRSLSNGGFPQSTSTTPKPPARTRREQKEKEKTTEPHEENQEDAQKKPNICSRIMGKCKSKCCPCCIKGEEETEEMERKEETEVKKQGMMSKFSCCKKKKVEEEIEKEVERAVEKGATIEYEDETRRKRKLRDIICCVRTHRVSDSGIPVQNMNDVTLTPEHETTGCCGRRQKVERRDSILSDRTPANCCTRMSTWFRGMCRRAPPPSSRRASLFSKNKSLSPTLPPEDTRKKLDPSLIEHTSVIRAAIPILPPVLAYFCLVCNVLVPGLGTIFSGLFCLCFGIPRFGPHDGAKYRIGSLIINILVGLGQLFTVLFCLVGWGWSVWWATIMIRISRKYRRLKAEAAAAEEEAPPVTTNNHTRA